MPFIPDNQNVNTSATPGFIPDPSPQTQGNPILNFTRGASSVARNIGLGEIPDVLGSLLFAGQKAAKGQNPTSADGQTSQQLQENLTNNPFMDAKTASKVGTVGNVVQDVAGVGSYLIPGAEVLGPAKGLLPTAAKIVGNTAINSGIGGLLGGVHGYFDPTQTTQKGKIDQAKKEAENDALLSGILHLGATAAAGPVSKLLQNSGTAFLKRVIRPEVGNLPGWNQRQTAAIKTFLENTPARAMTPGSADDAIANTLDKTTKAVTKNLTDSNVSTPFTQGENNLTDYVTNYVKQNVTGFDENNPDHAAIVRQLLNKVQKYAQTKSPVGATNTGAPVSAASDALNSAGVTVSGVQPSKLIRTGRPPKDLKYNPDQSVNFKQTSAPPSTNTSSYATPDAGPGGVSQSPDAVGGANKGLLDSIKLADVFKGKQDIGNMLKDNGVYKRAGVGNATKEDAISKGVYNGVKAYIDKLHPGTSNLTDMEHQLYQVSEGLQKLGDKNPHTPSVFAINQLPVLSAIFTGLENAEMAASRGTYQVGKALPKATSTLEGAARGAGVNGVLQYLHSLGSQSQQ